MRDEIGIRILIAIRDRIGTRLLILFRQLIEI